MKPTSIKSFPLENIFNFPSVSEHFKVTVSHKVFKLLVTLSDSMHDTKIMFSVQIYSVHFVCKFCDDLRECTEKENKIILKLFMHFI